VIRRDRLYREDGKLDSVARPRGDVEADIPALLEEIQTALHGQATARLKAGITPVADFAGIEAHFADGVKFPGWAEVQWAKPTGAALDKVVERLKALKLTLRNVPADAGAVDGACVFTGEPAVERVLVARAY
jgi:prolyl-tRNA synthetase